MFFNENQCSTCLGLTPRCYATAAHIAHLVLKVIEINLKFNVTSQTILMKIKLKIVMYNIQCPFKILNFQPLRGWRRAGGLVGLPLLDRSEGGSDCMVSNTLNGLLMNCSRAELSYFIQKSKNLWSQNRDCRVNYNLHWIDFHNKNRNVNEKMTHHTGRGRDQHGWKFWKLNFAGHIANNKHTRFFLIAT